MATECLDEKLPVFFASGERMVPLRAAGRVVRPSSEGGNEARMMMHMPWVLVVLW